MRKGVPYANTFLAGFFSEGSIMSRRMSVLASRAVSWKLEDRVITLKEVSNATPPSNKEIAQWLDLFSQGISNGVPILDVLFELAQATDNLLLKILSIEIVEALYKGETCAIPVRDFLWVELNLEAFLIDVGEETGELDTVLALAAKLRRGKTIASESCPLKGDKYLNTFYCLAILLDAGLPILRCLKILERDYLATGIAKDKVIAMELNKVCDEIETGSTLSEAMAKVATFGVAAVHAIAMGEQQGNLEVVLKGWFQ